MVFKQYFIPSLWSQYITTIPNIIIIHKFIPKSFQHSKRLRHLPSEPLISHTLSLSFQADSNKGWFGFGLTLFNLSQNYNVYFLIFSATPFSSYSTKAKAAIEMKKLFSVARNKQNLLLLRKPYFRNYLDNNV